MQTGETSVWLHTSKGINLKYTKGELNTGSTENVQVFSQSFTINTNLKPKPLKQTVLFICFSQGLQRSGYG